MPVKPRLDVEPTLRLLVGVHDRLELDDADGTPTFVRLKQVDRAALPESLEGHLGQDHPAERLRPRRDDEAESRVAFVEESVAQAAAPADVHPRPSVERRGDPSQGIDRKAADATAFSPRHGRLRDLRRSRQIRLAPAPMTSDGTDKDQRPTETDDDQRRDRRPRRRPAVSPGSRRG